MVVMTVANETELIQKLCSLIETTADRAIRNTGQFKIGLSGGSLVQYLCRGLPLIRTEWARWLLFLCDERLVPEDSDESTAGCYLRGLFPRVPLQSHQLILVQQGVSPQEAAAEYRHKLEVHFPTGPRFNLLLLGMGPDGHTCSLFPNHPLLAEQDLSVGFITDSPKPPPARITFTLPVLNQAECCVFAMCGEGKADMVKRILKDKEDLPAGRVQPVDGSLYWILDETAARLL